jgi:hypothetical protein
MNPQQRETKAFILAHVFLLCVVLIGFARTFYLRNVFMASSLPDRLAIHGIALTLWFVLVVAQGWLIQSENRVWHKRLAWLAVPVVIGVDVTGFWVTTKLLATLTSAKDPENMFIWADYASLLSFTAMVGTAVAFRHRLATHRRLILFASILLTGPAIGRVALWPILGLGLSAAPILALGGMALLVALAVIYDVVAMRRVQLATLGGLAGVALPWIAGTAIALSGVGYALARGG